MSSLNLVPVVYNPLWLWFLIFERTKTVQLNTNMFVRDAWLPHNKDGGRRPRTENCVVVRLVLYCRHGRVFELHDNCTRSFFDRGIDV